MKHRTKRLSRLLMLREKLHQRAVADRMGVVSELEVLTQATQSLDSSCDSKQRGLPLLTRWARDVHRRRTKAMNMTLDERIKVERQLAIQRKQMNVLVDQAKDSDRRDQQQRDERIVQGWTASKGGRK